MYFKPPAFLRRLYPDFIWNLPAEGNAVYLTFDDGPCAEVTPWLLDTLAKFNAKGTFFCLGKNAEMNPELFARIKAEGHAIGNHSYSHIKGWGKGTDPYLWDVDTANDVLGTRLFRPPYARISPQQSRVVAERYKIVMWNVLSRDYNRSLSGRGCLNNVLPYLKPGAVVVFHDSVKSAKNLWYALPKVLACAKERGLVCKPIEL